MAQSLIQRIALEGAEEIKSLLKDIGDAGKTAFSALGDSATAAQKPTGATSEAFQALHGHVRQIGEDGKEAFAAIHDGMTLAQEGTQATVEHVEKLKESLQEVKERAQAAGESMSGALSSMKVKGLAIIAAVTAVVAAFESIKTGAKDAAAELGELSDAADRVGVTFKQAQVYKEMGVDIKDLSGTLQTLYGHMVEVAKGTANADNPLKKYNISITDGLGRMRSVQEVAVALAKAISKTSEAYEKSGAAADGTVTTMWKLSEATKAGGAGFAKIIDTLADYDEANAKATAEVEKAGNGTAAYKEKVQALSDSYNKLAKSTKDVWDQVYLAFAPYITKSNESMAQFITDNKQRILDLANWVAWAMETIPGKIAKVGSYLLSFIPVAGIKSAALSVVNAITGMVSGVVDFFSNITNNLPIIAAGFLALGGVLTMIGTGITGLTALALLFSNPWVVAIGAVTAAFLYMYTHWNQIKQGIRDGVTDVCNYFQSCWSAVIDWFSKQLDRLKAGLAALKGALGFGGSSDSSSSSSGYARGGPVYGPGTSTSDSIPAYLSAGEFVQRAAAVRRYGLDFMHRVNNLSFPVTDALQLATGGFVGSAPTLAPPASTPATEPLRPFTLQIGEESFANLLAPEKVARSMVKFATNQQARSMGTKPSWY